MEGGSTDGLHTGAQSKIFEKSASLECVWSYVYNVIGDVNGLKCRAVCESIVGDRLHARTDSYVGKSRATCKGLAADRYETVANDDFGKALAVLESTIIRTVVVELLDRIYTVGDVKNFDRAVHKCLTLDSCQTFI